jgi:NAD(P)-dependent dehydrogenase (short-subunit alcohol dehydrogenase family)
VPRVVAITGGARGIGLATARAFAAAGARVAIGDVDADLAATVAAGIGGSGYPLDVRDRDSFAGFLAAVEAAVGPIDVLVNNAGVAPAGRFVDSDPALIDLIIDVNLRGVVHGMRLALPGMLARGSGLVLNIASLAGRVPLPGAATYGATKHALVGLTSAVRSELRGSGVTVAAVLPTFARTELVSGLRLATVPKVDAEQVAAAVVRLAGRRRPPGTVTVPRWMTPVGGGYLCVPPWLRERLATLALRAEQTVDPASREGYERRVADLLDR